MILFGLYFRLFLLTEINMELLTLRAFFAFSICVLCCQNLSAQGVAVMGPNNVILQGFGEVDLDKTVDHWTENLKSKFIPKMDLKITQLIEICQLDDADSKKLRIAVKGIISKRIQSGSKQVRQFAIASGLVEEDPDNPEEVEEFGEDDRLKFYGASPRLNKVVEFKSYFAKQLIDHPLWVKTLEKTLSDEQMKRYKDYQLGTQQRLLDLAIDCWIVRLDAIVPLSEKQFSDIRNRMKEDLKDEVSVTAPGTLGAAQSIVHKAFKNSKSLGDLLNAEQTKRRVGLIKKQVVVGSSVSWGANPNR